MNENEFFIKVYPHKVKAFKGNVTAVLVLEAMLFYSKDNKAVEFNIKRFSETWGMSRNKVYRAIDKLIENGYISEMEHKGFYNKTKYAFERQNETTSYSETEHNSSNMKQLDDPEQNIQPIKIPKELKKELSKELIYQKKQFYSLKDLSDFKKGISVCYLDLKTGEESLPF